MAEVHEELAAARVRPACARATPGENIAHREGELYIGELRKAQGGTHAKNDLSARGVWIEIDTHDNGTCTCGTWCGVPVLAIESEPGLFESLEMFSSLMCGRKVSS